MLFKHSIRLGGPTSQLSRAGFSILMAIGTIGVLLIIVTSLSLSYIRESKLSRYSYDGVITDAVAEGQFEYAMLKIRNHRDGFQDSVTSADADSGILLLSTPRSHGLQSGYDISASSTNQTFSLSGGQHLIVPLFAATGTFLPGSISSKDPNYKTGVVNTTGFEATNIGSLDWTIVAMSGSESVALTGNGDITPTTSGKIRIKASQCYAKSDGSVKDCKKSDGTSNLDTEDEELFYAYDIDSTVSDFITTKKDPYFIIYNSGTIASNPISISLSGSTAFTLPVTTVRSTARKGESSQIYEFSEDKGKYYDALKYGVYNTGP